MQDALFIYLVTEGQDCEPWEIDALLSITGASPDQLPLSVVRAMREALHFVQQPGDLVMAG